MFDPGFSKSENLQPSLPLSGSICTMCSREKEALTFCATCSHYLCNSCDFSHKMMKCFDFHHVVTLKELEDATHLAEAVNTTKLVNPDCLKKQFAEESQYLKSMVNHSYELRAKLEVLTKDRSACFVECNEQYARAQQKLRETRDNLIKKIEENCTSYRNDLVCEITHVENNIKETLLKLMNIHTEIKDTGEAVPDFDWEGVINGYYPHFVAGNSSELPSASNYLSDLSIRFSPENLAEQFNNSLLTPPFSDSGDQLASEVSSSSIKNNVEPYKPINTPVVDSEPNDSTINPDLSLSVSDPDSSPNNTNRVHSMQVYKTFGQKGNGSGQFHAPHGFCIGFDEDIVVADSSNHRIQIFDKDGTFKFHFGVAGRHDGYLWHPRKVAVLQFQRRYVVCDRGYERSRMQIFSVDGKFMKKIDIQYIDIVAGIAITDDEKIVIVDSVTPTVFILGYNDFLRSLDCKKFIEEPSDIAALGKELYICDFKGHNIVVIDLEGHLLRKFGCKQTTVFPNGIDISVNGEVLACDSHGNFFHIVAYSKDGAFIAEFRCPYIKVSRCCGLKITSEGRLVTVDKNYHHIIILDSLHVPSNYF